MPKKASDQSVRRTRRLPPNRHSRRSPDSGGAAADQVFTAALSDPQAYIRATRLAGAVAAHLRTLGRGAAPLITAWSRRREIVLRVTADDDLLTTEGVDVTAVAATAFAMRHREVAHEHGRRRTPGGDLTPPLGRLVGARRARLRARGSVRPLPPD